MKRALTLFGMSVALWAAASCSKSEINIQEPDAPSAESIKLNITVSDFSSDTKAIKKTWSIGDNIYVYLDDADSLHTPDFILTWNGNAWNSTTLHLDTAVVARLKASGGTIYGFWEDSNSCISDDKWEKPINGYKYISFPSRTYGSFNIFEGHLVADFSVPYTFDEKNRTINANINKWHFGTNFQIVVSGLEYTKGRYALFTDYKDIGESVTSNQLYSLRTILQDKDSSGKPIVVIKNSGGGENLKLIDGIENEDGVAFVGYLPASEYEEKYTFYLRDYHTYTVYTFKTSAKFESLGDDSKVTAVKIPFSKFYVDLGLSVKWGACNLGAKDVIDSGNYYAWAETEYGKTNYNWESYKYIYYGGPYSWQYVSKYTVEDTQYAGMWYDWSNNAWVFTGDGIGTLEAGDDAARQSNGEGWRTPTADEWKELMDKCTWSWNEDYAGNNVIEVTSKVAGYMGNKILLPVAGRWMDNTLNELYIYGAYWSSSIDSTDSSNAKCAYFSATQPTALYQLERCQGLSVRPVKVN